MGCVVAGVGCSSASSVLQVLLRVHVCQMDALVSTILSIDSAMLPIKCSSEWACRSEAQVLLGQRAGDYRAGEALYSFLSSKIQLIFYCASVAYDYSEIESAYLRDGHLYG